MVALADNLVLKVVSEIHDPVTTTDELIPSGETSSYRSNPLGLAEFTLSRKDPAYVGKAKEVQAAEKAREEGNCPADYTYVKENTFLLYPGKDFETYHLYEFYWTMTKDDDLDVTGNTNRYVYYVDMSGSIDSHIVGYKPGGEWNPDGNFFTNFGIRPVIVISKEYVKNYNARNSIFYFLMIKYL